jgi:hypothetical protein
MDAPSKKTIVLSVSLVVVAHRKSLPVDQIKTLILQTWTVYAGFGVQRHHHASQLAFHRSKPARRIQLQLSTVNLNTLASPKKYDSHNALWENGVAWSRAKRKASTCC